jgi:geranylgeranyl pyrophosphate synthase
MGAAFQIQDDVLNLVGDPDKYGKEIGGDIREGKRTMMLIHALQNCAPAEKKRMRVFLATPRERRSDADVAWVYEIMTSTEASSSRAAAPANWPARRCANSSSRTATCPKVTTSTSCAISFST